MSINSIEVSDQFSDGADIWVFSDIESSYTLKKVDWYLNYQFFNSNFKNTNKPTLVSAKGKLPVKFVLSIPFKNSIDDWSQEVKKICDDLQTKTVRIFLPKKYNNPNYFPNIFDVPTQLVIE